MAKKKFIIVSNRLPVSVTKKDGELVFTPSSGGLATALSRLYKNKPGSLWIGWPGICEEDITQQERKLIIKKLAGFGCHPVFLSRRQVRKYYDGYSNDTIWPLFHYFQTYVKNDASYWHAYEKVNSIFAEEVVKYADDNTLLWVHDYHLLLLPGKLRAKLPKAAIGFFLHVPFPSYEIFRLLPNRTEILQGMLGADLIGFHIYDYARHFLSSALRTLGLEGSNATLSVGERTVQVDAFPIGIDYEKFASASKDKKTAKELNAIKKHYKGMKIILSMDRLDYSKGILGRLRAFELFLENNPKYLHKVVLVMVAVPSRVEVPTYKRLKQEIEQTVSRINGKYASVDWSPISYQFRNLPFDQVAALLTRADVALLTPLRDGMNLVAKEYVATKQEQPGVLILSEMTGAIDEMPEAISVNPNDVNSIKNAIVKALEMPKSMQLQKINSMQKRLSQYNVDRWADDFMEQLKKSKELQIIRNDKLINKQQEQKILRGFKKAEKRLILLDYDGTVTNLVSTHEPDMSKPSKELLDILREISKLKNTALCVVSGRPKNVLDKWFKGIPMAMSAEHGAWIKNDNEWSRHEVSLNEYKKKIISLLKHYADRTPGATIEEKDFAIVWHYRNVPSELAQARNSSIEYELTNLLRNSDFSVFRGSKILEIKPTHINKGVVVEDMIAIKDPDFILCIGDDYTDEDMFRVMPDDAFSVKVGLGETGARYQVLGVEDVLKLLKNIIKSSK
ncbi:MAG TPA: bifunctional alpha,alpha-trehalose-phosphate synthase (UDP-forming)/trehalose-phosphatase [Candidatus Saccharimonadales bacterium]|nr:bifunctional alpha,alpha-trehalose-phosphate synthase (UDP-forming)/trehalose-phosphatase [Candidatus Saccharimonadales bacterium]